MCKKRLLMGMLFIVGLICVAACNIRTIQGSGDLVTENRQVSNFNRIELSGLGEVIVAQGGNESLDIETDDNVLEHLKVEVVNGTLRLGFEEGVNLISPTRLVFSVGVDDLNGLVVSGSGYINAETLETGRLDVEVSGSGAMQIGVLTADKVKAEISGSGEIDLVGRVGAQDVVISGSGTYRAGDLCSASVKVEVSGSGEATLCATETLDSDISGSGSVNYYGQPALSTSVSGSGEINSLGEK